VGGPRGRKGIKWGDGRRKKVREGWERKDGGEERRRGKGGEVSLTQ